MYWFTNHTMSLVLNLCLIKLIKLSSWLSFDIYQVLFHSIKNNFNSFSPFSMIFLQLFNLKILLFFFVYFGNFTIEALAFIFKKLKPPLLYFIFFLFIFSNNLFCQTMFNLAQIIIFHTTYLSLENFLIRAIVQTSNRVYFL